MLTGDVRKKESCGKLGVLHCIRKGDKVKIREEDKVFIVYKLAKELEKETTSEYKGWMFYSYEEYLETQETTESVDNEKDVIE